MAAAKNRFSDTLWEAFIKVSGWASSVIVIVIIIFLFKEGLSLFTQKPVDKELFAAVHPSNPVQELSSSQLREILYGDANNWEAFGGPNLEIYNLNVNNVEKRLLKSGAIQGDPETALGAKYENLPPIIDSLMKAEPGALLIFQERFLPKTAKQLNLGSISLGDFLAQTDWEPTNSPSPMFGALPLLTGTLLVTFGAILFSLLLGPPVAVYLAELAGNRERALVKPMIELLAGIPSVVFGFIGLVALVPFIQDVFNLSSGSTALAGSIILAIIALPTIISVAEDAIRSTPPALKEASLGLGATHWQTISRVVLPYCRSSMIAAIILGVGRIVGETMAVLMVTGNNPQMAGVDFLESVRTMSAAIAAEMGEAPQGGLHYKALFAVGCLLFLLTFIINLTGELLKSRAGRQ